MVLIAVACSKTPPQETLLTAREAIKNKDYAAAQKYLDDATKDLNNSDLSATQLSEMAVLYMILSDQHQNEEENVASAVACYEKAIGMAPDSVAAYLKGLPSDERYSIMMLRQMNLGADPGSFGDDEMAGEIDEQLIEEAEIGMGN